MTTTTAPFQSGLDLATPRRLSHTCESCSTMNTSRFCFYAFGILGAVSAFQSPTRISSRQEHLNAATRISTRARQRTALSLIEVDKVADRSIAEGIFGTMFDSNKVTTPVEEFFDAWNRQDTDAAVAQFAEDCVYEDGTYYTPFEGRKELQREFLLRQGSTLEPVKYVIDDLAVSSARDKVGVKYHLEMNGNIIPDSRHCAFYTINTFNGLIQTCYDVVEPVQKTGAANLAVLSAASKIIGKGDKGTAEDDSTTSSSTPPDSNGKKETGWWNALFKDSSSTNKSSPELSLPEQYFAGESSRR